MNNGRDSDKGLLLNISWTLCQVKNKSGQFNSILNLAGQKT